MNSFLIAKYTLMGVDLVIDGKMYSIGRKFSQFKTVEEYVKEYNTTKDIEKREEIKASLIVLMDESLRLSTNHKDLETDSRGNIYLVDTKEPIPSFLAYKMMEFINLGYDVEPLIKFWKNLLLNPDGEVRDQLFGFLEHNGHPITTEGYFLAYKAVRVRRKYSKETGEQITNIEYDENSGEILEEKYTHQMEFTPYHSGPHGMVIKVGKPVTMPRSECDSDPTVTCSKGLHVGSMHYVRDFGNTEEVILEVLVNPRNVVAVPVEICRLIRKLILKN